MLPTVPKDGQLKTGGIFLIKEVLWIVDQVWISEA
jgi:hypothetical protein